MRAEPLSCWRPTPERAADFASPPYDVFDRRQAASYVAAHPGCFLEIDRPETAFGPSQDMYAPEVYAKAAELMRLRTSDGTLVRDEAACYYIYRLEQGGHSQTGIVCACSANEYLDGTIRRHESTRHEKERDRIEHIRTTGAQSGPIFLTYRDSYALDVLVRSACTGSPLYGFTDEEGVRQTVWRIARPDAVAAIQAAFATVPCAYIADGHHRAASAVAVSLERRRAHGRGQGREPQSVPRDARADGDDIGTGPTAGTDPGADGAMMAERPWDLFLSVLFPASQLCVLPYNRVVRDRGGLSVEGLVGRIEAAGFKAGPPQVAPIEPHTKGRMGLYADGSWRELTFAGKADGNAPEGGSGGPVASLDVSLLQERILGPILGIADPREDPRISFVGGIHGTGELERQAKDGGVAFTLFPTSVDELMAVGDAGLLMPPKSTWFEPKLRSGLFIRRI